MSWSTIDKFGPIVISGNTATVTGQFNQGMVRGTVGRSKGKKYFEVTLVTWAPSDPLECYGNIGACDKFQNPLTASYQPGGTDGHGFVQITHTPVIGVLTGSIAHSTFTLVQGDVVGLALNLDTRQVYARKNGTWATSGDPSIAKPNGGVYANTWGHIADDLMFPYVMIYPQVTSLAAQMSLNIGETAFAYAPPTDYVAWIAPDEGTAIALGSRVLDNGLAVLNSECTGITVCSQRPTDYTEATNTYALGIKSLGAGNVFTAPQNYPS